MHGVSSCDSERSTFRFRAARSATRLKITTSAQASRSSHAECGAGHALYVVSDIKVSPEGQCSGGKPNCIPNWSIADEDLIVTQYDYMVPKV